MNQFFDVLIAIVAVAGILTLTRPGSQGPALVNSLASGFEGSVQAASGQTV